MMNIITTERSSLLSAESHDDGKTQQDGDDDDDDTFYESIDTHEARRKRRDVGVSFRNSSSPPPSSPKMNAQVEEHISSIRRWISAAHRTERKREGFFRFRSKFNVFEDDKEDDEEEEEEEKEEDLYSFPEDVCVDEDLRKGLQGLDACLLTASRGGYSVYDYDENGMIVTTTVSDQVDHIVESTAKIPAIMKTIMLIEDLKKRALVLRSPILRRVMLCRYSVMSHDAVHEEEQMLASTRTVKKASLRFVGRENRSWLLEILRTDKARFHRIFVQYLQIVSNLNVHDFFAFRESSHISEDDLKEFDQHRETLFHTVSTFRRIVPHIASLRLDKIEEASVTAIIHRAVDDGISTPFSTITIFLDIVSRILLLLTHAKFFIHDFTHKDTDAWIYNRLFLRLSGSYLAYRIITELMALLRISHKLFFLHFFNFWNIVNFASVVLAFWCNIAVLYVDNHDQIYSDLNGITTGLLWLSIVGFLKILNKNCAMLILSISNILRDLKLFLFLLVIFILAFGDMFYTLLSLSTETCVGSLSTNTNNNDDDFSINWYFFNMTITTSKLKDDETCPERYNNYFDLFRIIVGDVSSEPFEISPTNTNLFVLFTFFCTVIIVNMLIALAYDSYEQSATQSARLFGRARLMQVAQTDAYETLLHPTNNNNTITSMISSELLWKGFARMTFVLLQVSIVYFFQLSHCSWIICMLIFILQLEFTSLVITGWRDDWRERRCWPWFKTLQYNFIITYLFFWPIHWFVNRVLLGRQKSSTNNKPKVYRVGSAVKKIKATGAATTDNDDALNEDGEWKKRLDYVKDRINDTVSKCETELRNELDGLEDRIHLLDTDVRFHSDLYRKNVDERIDNMVQRLKQYREELLSSFEERVIRSVLSRLSSSTSSS